MYLGKRSRVPRRWKQKGPTARARAQRARKLAAAERAAKAEVRSRHPGCRFPLCGCRSRGVGLKGALTVSHDQHKGMGGNPAGDRSAPELMMQLCKWRHQDAPVSRHAGTLRTRYLSDEKNDGPVAFEVDLAAVYPGLYPRGRAVWFEVAREHYVEGGSGTVRLEPLTHEQRVILTDLAEMTR